MKIKIPTKLILIAMLRKEEEFRWSPEYQKLCDEVKDEINGWLRISKEYQYKIAHDFGFTTPIEADIAVNQMRKARYLYPEEKQFKTIPVYVRNNKATQCKYIVDSIVPNVKINQTNLIEINLYDILSKEKVNVIVASSHT